MNDLPPSGLGVLVSSLNAQAAAMFSQAISDNKQVRLFSIMLRSAFEFGFALFAVVVVARDRSFVALHNRLPCVCCLACGSFALLLSGWGESLFVACDDILRNHSLFASYLACCSRTVWLFCPWISRMPFVFAGPCTTASASTFCSLTRTTRKRNAQTLQRALGLSLASQRCTSTN